MGSRCYGVLIGLLSFLFLSGALGMNFSCLRPTTPCDTWHGNCQPDGRCACSNGASGLQCQISGNAKRNGGNCLVHNPCTAGTCYDDGVVAKCDCGEGYYGDTCRHPMVYAECDATKMVMNVLPYGYDRNAWASPPPLTGENFTCGLDMMSSFVKTYPMYSSRMWQGFAGVFMHVGDGCAGDPATVAETASSITYSRTVYISYNSSGPDPTDQTLVVTCDVAKFVPTPPPVTLPPPSVQVTFRTARDTPLIGPMKLGAKIHVYFTLNIPNSGNFDDTQVEMCTLRDNLFHQNVVVVDRACAQPPIGELLYKKGPGVAVLIMSVYKFPGMSSQVSFQCQVRVCNRNIDNYCSTPAHCQSRGKRSLDHIRSRDNNIVTIKAKMPV